MRQVIIYRQSGIGSPGITCDLTTSPATLQMRILRKNFGTKLELTCLSPGGKIKALMLETKHVDFFDPEPGVGNRKLGDENGHQKKNTRFGSSGESFALQHAVMGDPVGSSGL
jgi:hypothetical protein